MIRKVTESAAGTAKSLEVKIEASELAVEVVEEDCFVWPVQCRVNLSLSYGRLPRRY
jgi:hypothetical protein